MSDKETDRPHEEMVLSEAPIKWVLNVGDLTGAGRAGEILADDAELRRLTDLLNDDHDLEVKRFCCTYKIRSKKIAAGKDTEGVRGRFSLKADLEQTCVVTLERIDTVVRDEFDQDFISGPGRSAASTPGPVDVADPLADEPVLSFDKGRIEIGPLIYQYFAMAIDPNPRKPGALFEDETGGRDARADKPPSPFGVLKDYKHQK